MDTNPLEESRRLGNLLLQAGVALIKSGAGSNRVITNISRIAGAYGYEANIDLGTRNISISLHQENQENMFSGTRSVSTLPGANFKVIAAISQLSWDVIEKKISLDELISSMELSNVCLAAADRLARL